GASLNVGKTTSYQYGNLESNKTHYFSVTAYDTSGNESSPSPEVAKSITETGSLLSVSISGEGTVTSSPAGLSCSSGTCSGMFSSGSSVTLSPTPGSGQSFSGWGGSCTGTSSCVLNLTSSATVSATFSSTTPTVSRSLSVSLTGDGKGNVSSSPSGLTCSGGTCTASFPQGTTVTLTPTTQSGNVFQGWNGVCSGTSTCTVALSTSQVITAAFSLENSDPTPPKPNLPIGVNFQTPGSQVPANFKKDDGSVFTSTRGYGWSQLLNGTEQNSVADQTLDTFVSAANQTPATWNFSIPNGIYYVTMVLGDPTQAQGPHWVSLEGLQLAKQVKTAKGEYLSIVDYTVEVKDSTLSLTLGNSGQGQTTLNYVIINEKPNLPNTSQILTQSFGTSLVTTVLNQGVPTKINPVILVKKDQDEKERQQKAIAQREEQKKQEMAKLNGLKEKMTTLRETGGTVSLRNLLGGS
ncbi:MAG: hypothetical protein OEY57_08885, partial [Nitrospirota bacterium]|nr:hypothetical protein [Nitrospirota bacterium]